MSTRSARGRWAAAIGWLLGPIVVSSLVGCSAILATGPDVRDPVARELFEAQREVLAAPESASAHATFGDALARNGRFQAAIAEYRRAVEIAPENANTHFRLGLTLHALGHLEGALAAYTEAARHAPESAWTHAAISIVQLRLGDAPAALVAYRAVREIDQELAEGLLEILTEDGDIQPA